MSKSGSIVNLNFAFHPDQRKEFLTGDLGKEWARKYPDIFDKQDLAIYENARHLGRHFYEWLSAIIIFESTGYLSLVEKYWSTSHSRKSTIYESVAPKAVIELDVDYGWPDLFCYNRDQTDWFFCEAKGGADSLGKSQIQLFKKLEKISAKRVCLVSLKKLRL